MGVERVEVRNAWEVEEMIYGVKRNEMESERGPRVIGCKRKKEKEKREMVG